jgi:hypothetical protein
MLKLKRMGLKRLSITTSALNEIAEEEPVTEEDAEEEESSNGIGGGGGREDPEPQPEPEPEPQPDPGGEEIPGVPFG